MTEEYGSLEIQNLYLLLSKYLAFEQSSKEREHYPFNFFQKHTMEKPKKKNFSEKVLMVLRYGVKILRKIKRKIIK